MGLLSWLNGMESIVAKTRNGISLSVQGAHSAGLAVPPDVVMLKLSLTRWGTTTRSEWISAMRVIGGLNRVAMEWQCATTYEVIEEFGTAFLKISVQHLDPLRKTGLCVYAIGLAQMTNTRQLFQTVNIFTTLSDFNDREIIWDQQDKKAPQATSSHRTAEK